MQPAHQTLITVIGTAILLGAAEGASAQDQFPVHLSLNESPSVALGNLDSVDRAVLPLPTLVPETPQTFGPSPQAISEDYDFTEVAANLSLLEFSSAPKLSPGQVDGPAIEGTTEATPSAEVLAQATDIPTQTLDAVLPASDSVDSDVVDVVEDSERIEAADEATSVEQPETQEIEAPVLDAQLPESATDTEVEPEIEADAAETIEVEPEVDPIPAEETTTPERPEVSIPADGEIDSLADELDSADDSLIEIPDYLLAPSNPLFIPVEPETVEIEGTQPISLEEALEISRRNSRELESALQQLEQSQEALRQQRAAYLPTINSQTTLTHQDVDISDEPAAAPNAQGDVFPSSDGDNTVSTNLAVSVRLEYDIFTSGQRSASVQAAEKAVELQQLQVEVVREELRLNITSAYYDLQESDELVRIAEDTVEQSRISLRDALARERAGVGTRFDRLQAEVDLANDEQALSNALRDQQVTRRQLVELLSIPPGINISAADPVEVAGAWAMPLEETLVLAYRNRAELEQQLLQREIEQQQERATLANRWPQLSAFAQYSMTDLLDVTRSPADNETLSVGLQLDWALYNGGATRASARQEAIAAELAETQFADTREEIQFEVEQQYLNLGASFKNIQTANSAVGLAEESLRLARLRFGAGVGIQSDVLEAQTRLTEAEVNLVTAILDYNRALVGIQRAVSNLPDNNLSADSVREP